MTDISTEFLNLIADAERVSSDVGDIVRDILKEGLNAPLDQDEARALLSRVVVIMRERAGERQDCVIATQLGGDIDAFIERVETFRSALRPQPAVAITPVLVLQAHNGVESRPVKTDAGPSTSDAFP